MNIRYSNKIVAFLDVLGFSDMVFNDNSDKLESYFSKLPILQRIANLYSIQFYNFSDSIILIASDSVNDLYNVIMCIRKLQSELFLSNVLLRGGVSVGKLHFDVEKNIIVGPSFIYAYKLETISNYPRVIIDRKFIKHLKYSSTADLLEKMKKDSIYPVLAKDNDEQVYIDYLSDSLTRRKTLSNGTIYNILSFIQEGFYSNVFLEKYSWLKEKIIQTFKDKMAISYAVDTKTRGSKHSKNLFQKSLPDLIQKFQRI